MQQAESDKLTQQNRSNRRQLDAIVFDRYTSCCRPLNLSPKIQHFQLFSTCCRNGKNRLTCCWCGRRLKVLSDRTRCVTVRRGASPHRMMKLGETCAFCALYKNLTSFRMSGSHLPQMWCFAVISQNVNKPMGCRGTGSSLKVNRASTTPVEKSA